MPLDLRLGQPPAQRRELRHEHHPHGDGRPVPPAVALPALDGVPERVPVVEHLASDAAVARRRRRLEEVQPHDVRLHLHGSADEVGQELTGRVRGRLGSGLDVVEDAGVAHEPHLDDLGHAGKEVVARQRVEGVDVAEHPTRAPEGAHQVLAGSRVDPRLAADGRIDHSQERRGDLDDPDAAQPGGCHEAGQVGRRASAQADDGVAAREPGGAEHRPAEGRHLGRLRVLRLGHLDQGHLEATRLQVLGGWPPPTSGEPRGG